MKYLLILLASTLGFVSCQKQNSKPQVVVEMEKINVLYTGIKNPIKVAVSGYTAEQLELSAEETTIERDKGYFTLKPDISTLKKGVTLNISVNGKSVGQKKFRIRSIPYPTAKLVYEGNLQTTDSVQIVPFVEHFPFEIQCSIAHQKLQTPTDNIVHDSPYLSAEQLAYIRSLPKGSEIKFKDVAVQLLNTKQTAYSISFTHTID